MQKIVDVFKPEEQANDMQFDSQPAQEAQTYYGQPFKASFKMSMLASEAAYTLILDSQLPIGSLLVQSKQHVDILSIDNKACKLNSTKDGQNLLLSTIKIDSPDQRKI